MLLLLRVRFRESFVVQPVSRSSTSRLGRFDLFQPPDRKDPHLEVRGRCYPRLHAKGHRASHAQNFFIPCSLCKASWTSKLAWLIYAGTVAVKGMAYDVRSCVFSCWQLCREGAGSIEVVVLRGQSQLEDK